MYVCWYLVKLYLKLEFSSTCMIENTCFAKFRNDNISACPFTIFFDAFTATVVNNQQLSYVPNIINNILEVKGLENICHSSAAYTYLQRHRLQLCNQSLPKSKTCYVRSLVYTISEFKV